VADLETGSVELCQSDPGYRLPPAQAPTPESEDLQILFSQAGRALIHAAVPLRAANDLGWAWHHLGAARAGWTIVHRIGGGQMDSELVEVFRLPWEDLEVAAMSLGFGNTMSAIDLCADAVLLACHQPLHDKGRCYDLGELRKGRAKLVGPPGLLAWADQLLAHPDLAGLQECRDHMTHRTPRRHVTAIIDRRGAVGGRALAEISTLHGKDGVRWQGSIGDLIPRAVRFGEQQLELLCRAILALPAIR
jgi:hypothetical protein